MLEAAARPAPAVREVVDGGQDRGPCSTYPHYASNTAKATEAMRPSKTFNAIIDSIR
jgi:monomeric isocitrate dehydrogenase